PFGARRQGARLRAQARRRRRPAGGDPAPRGGAGDRAVERAHRASAERRQARADRQPQGAPLEAPREGDVVARIAGIDLGTTNSCVAILDRGAPTVIPSPEGERTTPSVVAFLPSEKVLVGVPARRQAVSHPQRTVFGAKRLIGRKVNAPDIERLARGAP